MKVFLSWSGARSKQVAFAMQDWLPNIINNIEPFISSEIGAGLRWQAEIASALDSTQFGIVFVTAVNQARPWLNFEAGALAKSVSNNSHVVPLAIDLEPAEIELPLGQFQAQKLDLDGVLHIINTMNIAANRPLADDRVRLVVETWWPRLQQAIASNDETGGETVGVERTERQILEEVLTTVRALAQDRTSVVNLRYELPMPNSDPDTMQEILDRFYIVARNLKGFRDVTYSPVTRTVILNLESPPTNKLGSQLQQLATRLNVDLRMVDTPREEENFQPG